MMHPTRDFRILGGACEWEAPVVAAPYDVWTRPGRRV